MVFKIKYLNLIHDVGSVSIEIFQNLFHEYIIEHVKINNDSQTDYNISLIRLLCNILENALIKTTIIDSKIDKKKIVVDEYLKLKPQFNNNDQHKEIVNNIIDDLHNTKQIKKLKTKSKLYFKIKSFVLSSNKK